MDDFVPVDRIKQQTPISAAQMERRRRALRWADANNRLEGIYRDPASDAIFEAHIRGKIELAEVLIRLKALPHVD